MGEFQYQIRVEHSPAPGCDWTAWVGFKPVKEGFSVLASFSDGTARLTRIARSRSPLNWRSACKALLRTKEEWLLDASLLSAEIHGLRGWQADLIKSSWFGYDCPHRREFAFLCKQSEEVLASLHSAFPKGLTGKECLDSISEIVELFGENASLARICKEGVSQASLLAASAAKGAETDAGLEASQAKMALEIAPFSAGIESLLNAAVAAWPNPTGYAAGIGFSRKEADLKGRTTEFVRLNGRLPTADEFREMEKAVRAITSFRL